MLSKGFFVVVMRDLINVYPSSVMRFRVTVTVTQFSCAPPENLHTLQPTQPSPVCCHRIFYLFHFFMQKLLDDEVIVLKVVSREAGAAPHSGPAHSDGSLAALSGGQNLPVHH